MESLVARGMIETRAKIRANLYEVAKEGEKGSNTKEVILSKEGSYTKEVIQVAKPEDQEEEQEEEEQEEDRRRFALQ